MTIEQKNKIDIAMTRDDQYLLAIVDHLPWEVEKLTDLLPPKINSYLNYILSGELVKNTPEAETMKPGIMLICSEKPPAEFVTVLNDLGDQLAKLGVTFEYETLEPEV